MQLTEGSFDQLSLRPGTADSAFGFKFNNAASAKAPPQGKFGAETPFGNADMLCSRAVIHNFVA